MSQPRHTVKSIDALLSGIPEAQPINAQNKDALPVDNTPKTDSESANLQHNTPEKVDNTPDFDEKPTNSPRKPSSFDEKTPGKRQADEQLGENSDSVGENLQDSQNSQNSQKNDQDTDEYGNPVAKPKMYTEEEVQNKIRERLRRLKEQEVPLQPTQQQVQQAQASGFEYNENSELSWSQQLEQFVENTMTKVSERKMRQQQEAVTKQAQAEFETKFHTGMAKYPDFVETLSDKPVSDHMMYAIRGLDNPAAFLYTAAKRAPNELSRIAKIADPYVQVAEMGRLHEKLTKPKPSSNAPKPLSPDRSDISERAPARVSIDHLIQQDAAARLKR